MRQRARFTFIFCALALTVVGCHKEPVQAPAEEGCEGAKCIEEVEAALWDGDAAAAREPLHKLCDDDEDAFSCFRLGDLYRDGKGGPVDRDKAASYYERACAGQQAEACERRFQLARDGVGGSDVELEYALKACDGDQFKGCMGAAELVLAGGEELRAAELYEAACGLGEGEGCTLAGDLLYQREGKFEYQARAFNAYISACRGYSPRGCLQLGVCLFQGIGTTPSVERARAKFQSACELGIDDGCRNQKRIDEAKGGDVTLQLTSRTDALQAGGLEARELSCQMDLYGAPGLEKALSAVARYRRKLNKCVKDGGAPVGIKWTFDKGKVVAVRGNGQGSKRYVRCVANELRKKRVPGEGQCSGILLLGDAEAAAAALPAKQPEPAPKGEGEGEAAAASGSAKSKLSITN